MGHRRHARSDDERSLALALTLNVGKYRFFRFYVDGGYRVVQNHNGRVFYVCARNGYTLFLSARKGHAPLARYGFVSFRKFLDVRVNVGKFRRVVHLVHIEILARERDVVFHLVAEKEVVLRNVAYRVSEAVDVAVHNVVTVDEHFASFDVVEVQKRVYERGFAASYLADDSNAFPRFDFDVHVFKHVRIAVRVRKRESVEFDFALYVFEYDGVLRIADFFFLVEEVGYAF